MVYATITRVVWSDNVDLHVHVHMHVCVVCMCVSELYIYMQHVRCIHNFNTNYAQSYTDIGENIQGKVSFVRRLDCTCS